MAKAMSSLLIADGCANRGVLSRGGEIFAPYRAADHDIIGAGLTLGISSSNIWVGGKSLGSVIGHNLFMSDPSLGGLVLLTPVCTDISDPQNRS